MAVNIIVPSEPFVTDDRGFDYNFHNRIEAGARGLYLSGWTAVLVCIRWLSTNLPQRIYRDTV